MSDGTPSARKTPICQAGDNYVAGNNSHPQGYVAGLLEWLLVRKKKNVFVQNCQPQKEPETLHLQSINSKSTKNLYLINRTYGSTKNAIIEIMESFQP